VDAQWKNPRVWVLIRVMVDLGEVFYGA
jgi:hypothetical protein